jgi:hypothetical protein
VEHSIYRHPSSPYLALLRHAGCERGDLEALVRRDGLDRALHTLRDAGVYVTFEEFKGRTPIVRGTTTITASARDFDNPSYLNAVLGEIGRVPRGPVVPKDQP